MMKTNLRFIVLAAAVAALPAVARAAEAQENWTKKCAMCHAADGSGATNIAKMRKWNLKNYTDPAVQAALTDEEIARVIKEGVKDDAGKVVMKAYGAELSADEVTALVQLIRGMAPATAAN